jgi:hypothetical protein
MPIFDEILAMQKFPKSQRKSTFGSLFHKNITIKKCIDSQIKGVEIKKRSHSVGDNLHSKYIDESYQKQRTNTGGSNILQSMSNLQQDNGDSEDSPIRKKKINQMEIIKESRIKKGFAILLRNQRTAKK